MMIDVDLIEFEAFVPPCVSIFASCGLIKKCLQIVIAVLFIGSASLVASFHLRFFEDGNSDHEY